MHGHLNVKFTLECVFSSQIFKRVSSIFEIVFTGLQSSSYASLVAPTEQFSLVTFKYLSLWGENSVREGNTALPTFWNRTHLF